MESMTFWLLYKDDRVGQPDVGESDAYVMTLKRCGVDIYTVKDGCISPETDDMYGADGTRHFVMEMPRKAVLILGCE